MGGGGGGGGGLQYSNSLQCNLYMYIPRVRKEIQNIHVQCTNNLIIKNASNIILKRLVKEKNANK